MNRSRIVNVVERELVTVRRNSALVVTALVFGLVIVALTWAGSSNGFVPVVLSLLTPIEVLVPAIALAFGYRAIQGDAQRGELEVLRTYPLSNTETVVGVYIGRATVLVITVLVPLTIVGSIVTVTSGASSTVFPTHGGADSIVLYVRFVVLTTLYALVALAAAIALSAAARSLRAAIALGTGLVVILVVGLDIALVAGLSGGVVPDGALQWLLAASPNSAYRGLVLQTVVSAIGTSGFETAPVIANLFGLVGWLLATLLIAREAIWRT